MNVLDALPSMRYELHYTISLYSYSVYSFEMNFVYLNFVLPLVTKKKINKYKTVTITELLEIKRRFRGKKGRMVYTIVLQIRIISDKTSIRDYLKLSIMLVQQRRVQLLLSFALLSVGVKYELKSTILSARNRNRMTLDKLHQATIIMLGLILHLTLICSKNFKRMNILSHIFQQ